jgi:hypothetical protein
MGRGRHFYPMARRERAALVFLIVFAALAFLPVWRTREALGMALFGWWMAALMLISPLVTLFAVRSRRRH